MHPRRVIFVAAYATGNSARKIRKDRTAKGNTVNSYKNLPEGYEAVREIDAVGNKRFAVGLNVAALLISALSGIILYFLRFRSFTFTVDENKFGAYLLFTLGLLLSMFAYLVLHELVHGIVYKLMTREKLTFGISFSCAYCGVPDVFVTKKTALSALVAPFAVFTVAFALPIAFVGDFAALFLSFLLVLHLGGCSGDLYDLFLLLFVIKGDVLMKDTGPKQTFYVRRS